ncbi:hypothetical protein [Streptomyces spectabilis]|uniref:Uncharacterized protein n=1 Tax=Streptomyces spectabilis TaxID=68270 RepID=A0A7W8ESB3_STRST|nr:hypothetical protein [Streptomyces spectabilis]MBB5102251.1 hypothetical protein [Streptomyces spectabilis]MCI3907299.1 hypothetical protein [Streptomyces spectabilis]GGV29730.1 hypothetical protein GCM10010245_48260 [Streptomyces spectabilis]
MNRDGGTTGHDRESPPGPGPHGARAADRALDGLLAAAHRRVGIAVHDRIMGQGGPPELRDPDLALDRMLATTYRQTELAVTTRLDRETRAAAGEPRAAQEPGAPVDGALMRRPAAVRLKYRLEALRIAHSFGPVGLLDSLRAALRAARRLAELLEAGTAPAGARDAVRHLDARLAQVRLPPAPRRRASPVIGSDYLAAVEDLLAPGAEQLVRAVRDVRLLFGEELVPCLVGGTDGADSAGEAGGGTAAPRYPLGADVVAQDLVDDLADAHDQAVSLCRAISDVERACTDFVGADLRAARLDGVQLEGIRWDAATAWPAEWEPLIRRASLPVGGERGVLVVAAEPYDSVVSADA